MTRDHGLFLLIGILFGFIVGYVAHESVVGVQPARIAAGQAVASGGAEPSTGAEPSAGGGSGQTPPMAEIQQLRAELEKNPNDQQALLTLANLDFDIQNWPRAQELYERLLKLRPNDPDVMTDLGITIRSQGDFQGALKIFRAAAALNPEHWQSRFNEAVVLAFDLKDLKAANQIVEKLRQLAPQSPEVDRLAQEIGRLQGASQ